FTFAFFNAAESGLERSDILRKTQRRRRPNRRAASAKANYGSQDRHCQSGLERSDIMKWTGEYIIDDAGQCCWHEGLRIQDEHMKSAYRKNSLIEFII